MFNVESFLCGRFSFWRSLIDVKKMDGRNEFNLQDVKAFKNNWFRFSFVLRDPELVRSLKLKI